MKQHEKEPMAYQSDSLKKISPHAVAVSKVTFHFLKRPRYQWVNNLLKAQNTLTLRQRKILRTSVFTLQTSKC